PPHAPRARIHCADSTRVAVGGAPNWSGFSRNNCAADLHPSLHSSTASRLYSAAFSIMTARVPVPFVVASVAAVVVPLAFDPASVRTFVGPKLALALALGALALPAALASPWPRLSRPARAVAVVAALHLLTLGIATTL